MNKTNIVYENENGVSKIINHEIKVEFKEEYEKSEEIDVPTNFIERLITSHSPSSSVIKWEIFVRVFWMFTIGGGGSHTW